MTKAINLLGILATLIWTGVIAIIAVPVFLFSEKLGHVCHRAWGRYSLALLGIRLSIEGIENLPHEGGFILAPNHESYFDILVMSALPIDFKWVSKQEVKRIPFIGWTMKAMRCFFVRRDSSGHDLNVMRDIENGLKSGKGIVLFPEGTRTRTGELLPFKKGAFRTAQNSVVPLIPIALQGTRAIAQAGKLPERRGMKVGVRIGKPFVVGPHEPIPQAMVRYREILTQLIADRVNSGC